MKKMTFILLVIFQLISCKNQDNEIQTGVINAIEIGKGTLNGSENIPQSNLVIKNQTDWLYLMTQMDTVNNVTESFIETDIDFTNYMVIAIFLEVKNNGWIVEINSIIDNENSINITKEETELLTSVIGQPYHIVKILKSEKNIIFE